MQSLIMNWRVIASTFTVHISHLALSGSAHATTILSIPSPTTTLQTMKSISQTVFTVRAPVPLNVPAPSKTYRPRPKEFSKDRTSIIAVILISTFCTISLFAIIAWFVYYWKLSPVDRFMASNEPDPAGSGVENSENKKMATQKAARMDEDKDPNTKTREAVKDQKKAERLSAVHEGNTLADPRNSILVCGGPIAVLDIPSEGEVRDPNDNRRFEQDRLDRYCWESDVQDKT